MDATDTEPAPPTAAAPAHAGAAPESATTEPAGTETAAEVELLARARDAAAELAELVSALGGLARAEASQSLAAFLRMLELRALGVVLVAIALVLASVGATLTLSDWLGSASAALFAIALVALLGAGLVIWRARAWRERIGFAETRAALAAQPKRTDGSGP